MLWNKDEDEAEDERTSVNGLTYLDGILCTQMTKGSSR